MKFYVRLVAVAAALLVVVGTLSAQPKSSTSYLKLNGGTHVDSLTFGEHISATYLIDSALGESECPPPPPTGIFDARWVDPRVDLLGGANLFGQGLFKKDLRLYVNSSQIDTFEVKFQPDSGFKVTLYWQAGLTAGPAGTCGCDSLIMHDNVLDGGIFNVNMLSVDSVRIAGPPPSRNSVSAMIIYRYGPHLINGVRQENPAVPKSYSLHQNYPNPFNPTTTMSFDILKSAVTEIAVYDVLGRKVAILVSGQLNPGTYSTQWSGTNDRGAAVGSGVYYVRMTAHGSGAGSGEEFSAVRKLLLMK